MPCACNSKKPLPETPYAELWEVAAILAVSEKTIRRMCQAGMLPHIHVGPSKKYRVLKPQPGQAWQVEPSEATRCHVCAKAPPAAQHLGELAATA
jgi:excisionase family DNA binding protein